MSCDADAFVIRQGDRLPELEAGAEDCEGPFDFTGWSLTFRMSGPVEVSGAATGTAAGVLSYAWAAGDTAVPGTYGAVFVGTKDGKQQTFPTRGVITVIVEPA